MENHCRILSMIRFVFRKISGYHEENALGKGGQRLSNRGEMMSILVVVISSKIQTAGLRVVKTDQRDSKGEMPDWVSH